MLRRIVDVLPPTWLGLALAAAGALAGWRLGHVRQDLVLLVAGWGAAALVAAAIVVVASTALALKLSWRPRAHPDERLEAGMAVPTGFSLPSLGWIPLVSLSWEWLEPEGVTVATQIRRGRVEEEATFEERGEHERTVRRLVVEDVFGLARMAFRLVEPTRRTVLPARGRPPSQPLLEALAGGDHVSHPLGPPDGDLVEMRRYAPGDPMKRVLWKTWAKARTLMVRLPERAVSPTRRTLAYLVAGAGDEPAAALARVGLEQGLLGPDWRFGADGSDEDARRLPEALGLIVKSRAARARGGEGLQEFLKRANDFGAGRCVLFAPARPGAWVGPVAEQIKRRPRGVEVILGADGVAPRRSRNLAARLLFADSKPAGAVRPEEIDEVARRLSAAGAAVTVVDRTTGKVTGRAHRRARA